MDNTNDDKLPTIVTFRHWLPIITFCPVNNLPDLIYITVEFQDTFHELYQLRKDIRKAVMWKKMFMEDVAEIIAIMFPSAYTVEVRLAFNRHVVTVFPNEADTHASR